ncbi:hypothetical protein GCM10010096_33940 [Alcaligenes pakistanensis]|uniref:Uncharacterized protein n=1 Tax=Alcaligenes pakistanensis TaxID=1482717 RepID=A0A8H9IPG3_9BURK|nr:hypothetical protein GCM10010096_33940 [Alcaligenes pakistanensis]
MIGASNPKCFPVTNRAQRFHSPYVAVFKPFEMPWIEQIADSDNPYRLKARLKAQGSRLKAQGSRLLSIRALAAISQ